MREEDHHHMEGLRYQASEESTEPGNALILENETVDGRREDARYECLDRAG
jgi:hypothetical protein